MLTKPIACPKAKPDPRRRTRTHQKRLQAFRDAVWLMVGLEDGEDQYAFCEGCGRMVWRFSSPFGSVDHIKLRSTAPELKYHPANGQILCEAKCHPAKHGIRGAA